MKNIKNYVAIVVMVLVLGGLLKYFYLTEEYVIEVGHVANIAAASHHVAIDKEMYEKAGLKISVTQFTSSNQLYEAVAKGDIDITSQVGVMPVILNHPKDPGLVKIFNFGEYNSKSPFDGIVVMDKSPVKDLKNLEGKKIGLAPGSTSKAFLAAYLKKQGVNIAKVSFVEVAAGAQLQALEAGSIDALYAYEANLTTAIVKLNARKIGTPVYSSFMENNPSAVGIMSKKFVDTKPDLAAKIVRVYDDANKYMKDNDKETRLIIARQMKIDKEVAERISITYLSDSGNTDKKVFEQYLQLLKDLGEISNVFDVSELFYR